VSGAVSLVGGRPPAVLRVHVRLPDGLSIRTVSDPSARIVDGGATVEWTNPPARLSFTADVGK